MKVWMWKLLGAGAALTFTATTFVCGCAGYLRLFTYFGVWDDEGYLLLSLRSFLRGESLYDAIYSQYGPFYYLSMGGVFHALGLNANHDNGRLVSLALWLAASLGVGLILYVLTHNLWLAGGFQLVAFKASLFNMAYEPMHPGGMICLLLVGLAAMPLLLPTRPRLASALQGVLVAALTLIKINVGAFAFLALFLAMVMTYPPLARRRVWGGVGVALFVAAPTALLAANLGAPWAQRYAILVTASALAVALTLVRTGATEDLGAAGLRGALGSAVGATLGVIGLLLLRGTSFGALLHGVLIDPLRHASAFTIPLDLPPWSLSMTFLALATSGVVAVRGFDRWQGAARLVVEGVVRLSVGVALAVTVSGVFLPRPYGFVLVPWAWVAVWKPQGLAEETKPFAVFRRFVPPLAVLQALHAYPVAGSQVQWGAYLLVFVAGLCVVDGARLLAAAFAGKEFESRQASWLLGRAVALVAAGLILRDVWLPLRHDRLQFANTTQVLFPGSRRIHLPYQQVEQLAWVVRELRANCSTFVSLPGLNSFHLWSELEPPTSWNATAWMFLFDSTQQARIVERIRPLPRLCLLRHEGLSQGWQRGRPLPRGPLVDFLSQDFVRFEERGGYEIWVRAKGGPTG